MAFFDNYFGIKPSEDGSVPIRGLPASWFTSQEMYDLERRAIFSKKWLLTTHKLRVPKSGDWVRYDVAGFQFIIVQDRHGSINGFHNVCRHRAFPIVTEEKGNSSIFACKYHGWSYGLNGKLAKVPGYQDLEDFDKAKNSLLPVHVHVDKKGFIWVNMDGGESPQIAWSDDFANVDEQSRFDAFKFEDYQYDHDWQIEGEYNWKVLADTYKPTTDAPGVTDLSTFPSASMNVSPHLFFVQRFIPLGPSKSGIKYEVYRNKNSSDEDFEAANAAYKKALEENVALYTTAQKNLTAETQPKLEASSLYFQNAVRELLQAHRKLEVDAEEEIWPSRQSLPKSATSTEKDIGFCSAVDCCRKKGPITV